MPLEHVFHIVVVAVSICTDRQQVLDNRSGGLKTAGLYHTDRQQVLYNRSGGLGRILAAEG